MGVNIMFAFGVEELADEAETESVANALTDLVREEGFQEHEVGVRWDLADGRHWVAGQTDYPIGISRFYAWRPRFEAAIQERVYAVAPSAKAGITFWYPDELAAKRESSG
ncbi:hypothetical protein [Streptomyces sp. NBC_01506]|uniref:hypothetical protein n=1 Tax=Streptomyces sp. NBC_01506 TaxID=2903887 RepID=UPI003867BB14